MGLVRILRDQIFVRGCAVSAALVYSIVLVEVDTMYHDSIRCGSDRQHLLALPHLSEDIQQTLLDMDVVRASLAKSCTKLLSLVLACD